MNSIFRKTLIATALSAILSTAAIAADDYQETIDGDTPDESRLNSQQDNSLNDRSTSDMDDEDFQDSIDGDTPDRNQGNSQQNNSMNDRSTSDMNNEDYPDTIDGDTPAGNQVNGQQNKSSLNDGKGPCNDDMKATGNAKNHDMDKQDSKNRPLTDHQDNVIEEEEEEEEVMPDEAMPRAGDEKTNGTEIDYSEDSEMNIQMEEDRSANKMDEDEMSSRASNLYSMSPDDLIGMNVVDSDGEEFGHVSSIVLSPDQENVHTVITVGSIMGLGGRDVLASLDELTLVNDELHIKANKDEIAGMTDYGSDDFIELEGDTAISTAVRPK